MNALTYVLVPLALLILILGIIFKTWLRGNSVFAQWTNVSVLLLTLIAVGFIGIKQNSINQQLVARPILKMFIIENLQDEDKNEKDILKLSKDGNNLEMKISLENVGNGVGKIDATEIEACFIGVGKDGHVCTPKEKIATTTPVFFPNDKDPTPIFLLLDSFKKFEGDEKKDIVEQGLEPEVEIYYTIYYHGLGNEKNKYITKAKISMDKSWKNPRLLHLDVK